MQHVCIKSATSKQINGGLMLVHRLWRWASIEPALVKSLVFFGSEQFLTGSACELLRQAVVWKQTSFAIEMAAAGLRRVTTYEAQGPSRPLALYNAVQSKMAVSAYFTSKQILPFGFAEQGRP